MTRTLFCSNCDQPLKLPNSSGAPARCPHCTQLCSWLSISRAEAWKHQPLISLTGVVTPIDET